MAIQSQLANGSLIGGGGAAFLGANVHVKPVDYGTLGHYRVVAATALSPSQAAASRLFEIRNSGSNLIIPLLVEVEALAVGDVAPEYSLRLDMYGCTNFTAVDTTNTSTPSAMVVRPTGMSAAPGGAQVRSLASTFTAGMTGGTLTKDAGPHSYLHAWMSAAAAERPARVKRFVDPADLSMHPPVYGSNQGFVIEHATLGPADANTVLVVITVAWAEVPVGGF
ncbi:MAG TPA: hypothetical protein DEH78_08565 [Solibacterales bacterium]|nr:hypothetical protein [Bryobacterales bacterium]